MSKISIKIVRLNSSEVNMESDTIEEKEIEMIIDSDDEDSQQDDDDDNKVTHFTHTYIDI